MPIISTSDTLIRNLKDVMQYSEELVITSVTGPVQFSSQMYVSNDGTNYVTSGSAQTGTGTTSLMFSLVPNNALYVKIVTTVSVGSCTITYTPFFITVGSTGNVFDQTLNTNSDVKFDSVTTTKGATLTGPVGIGGAALTGQELSVISTTKGFGLPVMTTAQRITLGGLSPAEGTTVYDSDLKQILYWHTTKWDALSAIEIIPPIDLTGQTADIPYTPLLTPIAGGLYRFTSYANQAGGSGNTNPTLYLQYTDHVGLNTDVIVGAIPVQHPGTPTSLAFTLYSVGGQPINYKVAGGSYGTASYDLAITLVKLS